MKLHRRFGFTVLARLSQVLRAVPQRLGLDAPQPAESLVPIPVRAGRPIRLTALRDRHRGD
jgi:hypothetical protein